MAKNIKKMCSWMCAFGTALFLTGTRDAKAIAFDFAAIGAANEFGTTVFNQSGGGLSFAVTTYDLTTNSPYYVYLDGYSGGNEGGLGSCKQLTPGGQCDDVNNLDEQIDFNEVVKIEFDQPVTLSNFEFQNGNHEDNYDGFFGVMVDQTPVDATSFVQFLAAPTFAGPISGTTFYFVSAMTIGGVNDLSQITRNFYISRLNAVAGTVPGSVVPEPMTLSLLGVGALAAFRRNRRIDC